MCKKSDYTMIKKPRQLLLLLLGLTLPLSAIAQVSFSSAYFAIEWQPGTAPAVNILDERLEVDAAVRERPDGLYRLRVGLLNPTDKPLSLQQVKLFFGGSIEPFNDSLGGYGSEIYAFRDSFLLPKVSADVSNEPLSLPAGSWYGWQNRYDLEAVKLLGEKWESLPADSIELDKLRIAKDVTLAPGASINLDLDYYFGPRDRTRLEALGLETLVLRDQWNWFRALCQSVWFLLDLLYVVLGHWGLAIIFLALIIRLFTIPITRKSLVFQQVAFEQQQRVATKQLEIKKAYSGIALSEKIVELYESEGYDHLAPFKGMLGLFIQIPILIALFTVIGDMSALRGAPFLWIEDLSLSDRLFSLGITLPFFGGYFNLLPWLMAIVTILSTWQASRGSEKRTPVFSLFGMALLFFIFFYSFPAALVLYWLSSNLFQLIQQMLAKGAVSEKTSA
jgi:YidC/Oxa1 family membrane protein insertase